MNNVHTNGKSPIYEHNIRTVPATLSIQISIRIRALFYRVRCDTIRYGTIRLRYGTAVAIEIGIAIPSNVAKHVNTVKSSVASC